MTDINEIEKYVISHLDDAIANKWIEVYYQPVVRTITGKICGCEALARWHDPHYGLLSPFHFVPALETSGDIYKLDLTIIEKVCQDLHFALSTHKSVIPLSINLSRHDFSHENLIDDINSLTQHYEIPHRLLNIEITESLFVEDLGMIKKFINAFHQEGYQVWMDDFGSGYSSLGVLKDFDFDEIKIDMSFLTNFNDKSKEIIKSVVRMAKLIGIQTLAEGVETKEQYEFLKDIGCEKIQGYYFGRPMPQALLREHFRKKGIARENLAYQHFYDAIAQIDYQTYAPLLVCTLKNKQFHFLHVNEAYKQILKRDDIKSVSQWEQILNDQTNPMHRLHLEVARKTYRRQAPTIITYPRGDHYMELTVEYIAQQNNVTAFKAELHYIDIKHPDREDIKIEDEYVRDIYYACHDIAVMDLKNDTIREIKSGNSDQPIAHHPISHDIRNIFDRYQNGFIHKADQEAFRRFYDFDSLQNRLKKAPNGLVSEYFRSKNDDDYMWVHHMYIAIPKTHYQKILIFAISADVDHDKLMKILERDRYVLKDRMEIS
jgi:EAL domain-containing protein (putative c-di-GMP-specific phosphodiesterase class I)